MSDLSGVSVLVTGAHRGIGAACAKAFAMAGAVVACVDVLSPAQTVSSLPPVSVGPPHLGLVVDVADAESVSGLFDQLRSHFDELDVVVHCAGIIYEKGLLETDVSDFDRVIRINLRGTFLIGKGAISMMASKGGRVILTASDLAYAGRESFSAYVASKHAVLGLARSWAKEFAPSILVNAICPGPVDTEMLGASQMSAEWRARELQIPVARFGQPEEIAAMAVFLAGPGGAFITGQGIGVNGGSVMP